MKDQSIRPKLITAVAAALIFTMTSVTFAQVRTAFPSPEDPGPPFYARVERESIQNGITPRTSEWVAIVFYRSPECIPNDFNLLNFFDVPQAFSCVLTIDGFDVWRNGPPPIDFAPMMAMFHGSGDVPIWFVSWPELEAAIADDELTVTELMAMDSLITGSADRFHETLHPTEGAINPRIVITAQGYLSDGRTFQLQHSARIDGVQTRINFR